MTGNSNVVRLPSENLGGNKRASPSKRMTIQFSSELNEGLERIASQQGISQAEAVRKAVALEIYLRQALERPGARLLIEDDKSIKEVIIR